MERFVTHDDLSCSTHVIDTDFAACRKERSFQRVDSLQFQCLLYRHGTTHHHSVVHGIDHIHLIFGEYTLNKEIATQTRSVIMLCIFRMSSISELVICFHINGFDLFVCKDTKNREQNKINYLFFMPRSSIFANSIAKIRKIESRTK